MHLQHFPHVGVNRAAETANTDTDAAHETNLRLIIMAYVNSTRIAHNGFADRLNAVVASVKTAMQRRRIYAQTVRELNNLTTRELADLGIAASQINAIAKEAAYGN